MSAKSAWSAWSQRIFVRVQMVLSNHPPSFENSERKSEEKTIIIIVGYD